MNDDRATAATDRSVKHRYLEVDGVRTFYREAGPDDAAVVLLPHGYPCSSFQFRRFVPALADRWRLLRPCGALRQPAGQAIRVAEPEQGGGVNSAACPGP